MKNFVRALKLALAHRWTVAGALFSSLMVALMWGTNITAVYPFIEVVFQGESMHTWIDQRIARSDKEIQDRNDSIADLEKQLAVASDDDKFALQNNILMQQSRLEMARHGLKLYHWLQPKIKQYLPNDAFQTLVCVVVYLLIGTLIKDVFLVAHQMLVARLTGLTTLELRQQFYRHVLKMDLGTFGKDRTGPLMGHFTNDLNQVVAGMGILFGDMTREPLKMIVCIAGAAFINWRLLLFSFVFTPIALYFMNRLSRHIKKSMKAALDEVGQFYHRLAETFTGIQLVKAYNTERFERRRFRNAIKALYLRHMQATFLYALTKPNTELLGIVVICLALLAGGYLVLYQATSIWNIPLASRPMDFGSLMAFFAFLAGASDPARKFSSVFGDLHRGAIAADRLFPMLDRLPGVRDSESPRPMPESHTELIFDNVKFQYGPDQPVILENMTLHIPFGQSVAIVGPNGCGKSTLVNLIMRFYDPVEGAVRLDFTDLREIRQRDLRAELGMVTQQPHLFDDTVLENIRYGSLHASDEQVMTAAKQAHAHKFIESLPQGYHTNVGERGGRLSGGQRQRIALARAILRDPQILILDEATSQIDPESEALIHNALEEFIQGRTTIMITHRLSTLSLADRIIVMDRGKIIGDGRHQELLERCETYRRLHRSDFRESA